jgi:PIN domain nuclease of toxin-antitoxin system
VVVIDASVMLASLLDEAGRDRADLLFETQACGMSVVNFSEAHARLLSHGMSNRDARSLIDSLEVRELEFDRRIGELAAALRGPTRAAGLSLADRACIATGIAFDAMVATADRAWSTLDVPVDIQLVR